MRVSKGIFILALAASAWALVAFGIGGLMLMVGMLYLILH